MLRIYSEQLRHCKKSWMPACAGMTGGERVEETFNRTMLNAADLIGYVRHV